MELVDEPELLGMLEALRGRAEAGPLRGVLATAGRPPTEVTALRRGLPRRPSARRPLHPLLAPGTPVSTLRVSDYEEKDRAVARVGDWAAELLPRRDVAALEGALDELLLNALYDAPRDASGAPRYRDLSPTQRAVLPKIPAEHAELRYACDRERVVVSVEDRFGALRAATVLDYLTRCAEAQRARSSPLERKTTGAGIGLFLVACAASELLFRLAAGRRTQVVFTLRRDRTARSLRALVLDERD